MNNTGKRKKFLMHSNADTTNHLCGAKLQYCDTQNLQVPNF